MKVNNWQTFIKNYTCFFSSTTIISISLWTSKRSKENIKWIYWLFKENYFANFRNSYVYYFIIWIFEYLNFKHLIHYVVGCTIIIGFTVVIPFTMIMVGGTYMDECPVENIPTFLLIGGLVWMFKNLMNCWTTCHRSNDESYTEAVIQQRKNESLLNCFLFGWFIAGL